MKKTATLTFFVFCLSLFATSAFAYDCQNKDEDKDLQITQKLNKQLGFADPFMAVCKTFPNNANKTIFVLINHSDLAKKGDDCAIDDGCKFDFSVLVVNNQNGSIDQKFTKKNAFSQDAVQFENLKIDTGRYQLSNDIRAFGFRLSYMGPSRVAPYTRDVLYLFRIHGNQLLPVFEPCPSSNALRQFVF